MELSPDCCSDPPGTKSSRAQSPRSPGLLLESRKPKAHLRLPETRTVVQGTSWPLQNLAFPGPLSPRSRRAPAVQRPGEGTFSAKLGGCGSVRGSHDPWRLSQAIAPRHRGRTGLAARELRGAPPRARAPPRPAHPNPVWVVGGAAQLRSPS